MLKLGCNLPNSSKYLASLVNYCKDLSPHRERQGFMGKKREDMVSGPSTDFRRKAVADKTFIRDSTNWCKSLVWIDASQFFPFPMCQARSTGLCPRWELDSESGKFKPRQNTTSSFERMVMSYCQGVRQQCNVENFYTTGTQRKLTHTVLMAFVDLATLCLKLWDAVIVVVYVKKLLHLSLRKKFNEAIKRS